jgi:hypothetical protein
VSWPYLLEILTHLGFGQRWRNWMAALWSTSSSSFLLNGIPGKRILHARGVRQGDPLSPMLFLLAMEPLHRLFQEAQSVGALQQFHKHSSRFRVSLYADDAAVFIKPTSQDFETTKFILEIFGQASGLITNMEKTEIFPISCQDLALDVLVGEQLKFSEFPATYLGLPLHYKKLPKSSYQPLVQKIGNRLPGWKRKLLSYPGRETLVKSVLSSMPTYFMTAFKLPKWAILHIDRYRRSFLWRGNDPDRVQGGHCLVRWKNCIRPRKWGGLGILDLENFGRALRLRWLWHSWDEQERPWKPLLKIADRSDRDLFFASTSFEVGDGALTPFWEACWLNGKAPRNIAPNLYGQVRFRFRSVQKELKNNSWIRNLKQVGTETLLEEFVSLFVALREVQLSDSKDFITWRWTANKVYSTKSAYETQFLGAFRQFKASTIWHAKAEPRCKFFAWLAIQGKAPTADNLTKKNWPCNTTCSLCFCLPETVSHLLSGCNFAEAVWLKVMDMLSLQPPFSIFCPEGTREWFDRITSIGTKQQQKRNVGVVFLFWWQLWKERNRRVFEGQELSYIQVAQLVVDCYHQFNLSLT